MTSSRRLDKVKNLKGLFFVAIILITGGWACNMSTANLSSLKTSKDKEGAQETTTYAAGETIFATAAVSNNPGKVTVKIYMIADEAPGMKKGDTVPNSEVKVDIDGDGRAKYNFPTFPTTQGGKFTLVADMLNETGEKKDSKSVSVTIEPGSPGAATPEP
jgi:hypothetical protein